MEIGKPRRVHRVEPLREPVPERPGPAVEPERERAPDPPKEVPAK